MTRKGRAYLETDRWRDSGWHEVRRGGVVVMHLRRLLQHDLDPITYLASSRPPERQWEQIHSVCMIRAVLPMFTITWCHVTAVGPSPFHNPTQKPPRSWYPILSPPLPATGPRTSKDLPPESAGEPWYHVHSFFYKNLVYKNIKASNGPKIKNILRTCKGFKSWEKNSAYNII